MSGAAGIWTEVCLIQRPVLFTHTQARQGKRGEGIGGGRGQVERRGQRRGDEREEKRKKKFRPKKRGLKREKTDRGAGWRKSGMGIPGRFLKAAGPP